MNKILVIIVTYNGMQWIQRCLNSLRNSRTPVDTIVIDNGSTDDTIEFIRKNYPEIELIESESNLGFGKANNIGLKKTLNEGYDYAYLLNQDAWILPDTIEKLISLNCRNSKFGIISPLQVSAKGNLDKNFEKYVCTPIMKSDGVLGKLKAFYEVEFAMAAHWLISRECIKKVGGFSPTFPHYGEDDDYINRAKYLGFKVGVATIAQGVHDREGRPISIDKQIYMDHIRALVNYSNPLKSIKAASVIKVNYINTCRAYRKFSPLKYLKLFLRKKKEIDANKVIGICGKTPFLN